METGCPGRYWLGRPVFLCLGCGAMRFLPYDAVPALWKFST